MGDVLVNPKADTLAKLHFTAGTKPEQFENWVQKTRVHLHCRHSQLVRWWDAVHAAARAAYDGYVSLSPLQRCSVRQAIEHMDAIACQC